MQESHDVTSTDMIKFRLVVARFEVLNFLSLLGYDDDVSWGE